MSEKLNKKNSFIMYLNYEDHFKFISDKEIGILMRGIFQYIRTGEEPNFNGNAGIQMAFSFIKTNIDIDANKYTKRCERNREIANGRWRREHKEEERQEFSCHLGSQFKCEDCFKCLKKHLCTLPESPAFKLHYNCSFEEWNLKKEFLYEEWCKDRVSKGLKTDLSEFEYDWLNDDNPS